MKTKKPLMIFIAVTLASGWLGVLLDKVLTDQPEGNSLGMGLWLILPFLAALILRIVSRDGEGMGLKPNFRKSCVWYLAALLIYPVVTIIVLGLAAFTGGVELSGDKTALLSLAATAFLFQFVKNIFEEFAWRGYLTPKLIELKLSDWSIYTISGLVWGLWHAAYYIVFLPDGDYFMSMPRGIYMLYAVLLMVCWNVMYVEIYRLAGSVWPCVLMHAIEDAVPALLVAEGYIVFTGVYDIVFNPASGIIATGLFLAVGFILRSIRIRKELRSDKKSIELG